MGEPAGPRMLIGHVVMPWTKRLRAWKALRHMTVGDRHLDIGCGDGYLLSKSPCREKIGIDRKLGKMVTKELEFKNAYFDYVTMLAVVEHFEYPREILAECARVLKPGGKLIMTTPLQSAEKWICLYVKGIEDDHEHYFDLGAMKDFTAPHFEIIHYEKFLFGMNQLFVCEKS